MPEVCSTTPPNLSPLHTHGFQFNIIKLPDVNFFVQQANLPSLTLGDIAFENPLVNAPIPGEKLEFGDLTVQFVIDEEMVNYISVHNWMIGLGFPETHAQYRNFIRPDQSTLSMNESSELMRGYSDATLTILNNNNLPSRTIHFVDIFPTSLDGVDMDSTVTETTMVTVSATFAYSYYFFS